RAPVGLLAINKNPVTTNQGFKSLVPKKNFDVEFLYYLLKEKGLTIEGAKKHLRTPEEEDKKTALLDKLRKVKEELERLKSQL
ncbi:MAG: restriction endonuclease subunit S, partial [Flavobacteriaceae bacterium]